MAQKKSYSRYFIILQEDEYGYSLASDKLPSGYTKLETKGDKCKISYYVQNLKKEKEPYHMVLICNKRDAKKLIKLGVMNIDDYGRAEITFEYNVNNICGVNIPVELVGGAAIVRIADSKIISVMSGFVSSDIPKDWRSYSMIENRDRSEDVEEEKVPQVTFEDREEEIEKTDKESNEDSKKESKNIFEEYEKKIEVIKEESVREESHQEETERVNGEIDKEESSNLKQEDIRGELKEEIEELQEEIKEEMKEEIEESGESTREELKEEVKEEVEVKEEESCREEFAKEVPSDGIVQEYIFEGQNAESSVKEAEIREEEKSSVAIKEPIEKASNSCDDKKYKIKADDLYRNDYPDGKVGEFFKLLAEDFEEVKDKCKEIKKCRWYRIPVDSLDDMCNASNYNKYTMFYYPMLTYYPYIKKCNHYMIGYKYDNEGRMKYLVYAIPGTRSKIDQPYGGKSGFVTWVPEKEGDEKETSKGYWLMFYDFRTSTIAIPVK